MGKIPILLMEVWEMVCFYFLFFIITFIFILIISGGEKYHIGVI